MFKVNEIKGWAKKYGFTVKKQEDGYVWFEEGGLPSTPKDIEQVARDIFNKITDNRFVEHQNSYSRTP
jgi:hypothetical protein